MYQAIAFLKEADSRLGAIISQLPEPVYISTHNVFHDLMSCVLEQQIHYRSMKKIFEKLLHQSGLEYLTPDTFSQFEERALSSVTLSMAKVETVARVLEFFQQSNPDWNAMSDQDVRKTLSALKGVGVWTQDMLLLYTLQRPNILPLDDFHLKEIMCSIYGLDTRSGLKKQMRDIASGWGEHGSLAVRYLLDWKKHKQAKK